MGSSPWKKKEIITNWETKTFGHGAIKLSRVGKINLIGRGKRIEIIKF